MNDHDELPLGQAMVRLFGDAPIEELPVPARREPAKGADLTPVSPLGGRFAKSGLAERLREDRATEPR